MKETVQPTDCTTNIVLSSVLYIWSFFLFLVTVIELVRDAKFPWNVNHAIHHMINQSEKKKKKEDKWEKMIWANL